MIYFLSPECEIFATENEPDSDLYDHVIINTSTKKYFLLIGEYDYQMALYNLEEGQYIKAQHINREAFDTLISALENHDFKRKEMNF